MTRTMWMVVIGAAVAFVVYTYWKQNQVAPRVPVASGGGGAASSGGGGLLDSLSSTVKKLTGIFEGLAGRPATTTAPAPLTSSDYGGTVTWI